MALVKVTSVGIERDKFGVRLKYPNRKCKLCRKYPCFPEIEKCSSNFAAYGCVCYEDLKLPSLSMTILACLVAKETDTLGYVTFCSNSKNYYIRSSKRKIFMATKLTTKEFIEKAEKVHGEKYNYGKVDYVNSKQKVCIICPEHGEFWQIPNSHLLGKGYPKCAVKNKSQCNPKTTELFVEEARKVHGSFYDYSKTSYSKARTKVIITCPIHGDFIQRPCDHIHQKQGCPKCSLSKGELLVAKILNDLGINYIPLYMFEFRGRKFYIDFSFYLNDQLYFVEYNGRLHYIPVEYFGGKIAFDKLVLRDLDVRDYCKEASINLIELRYDNKNIKSIILLTLGDNSCKTRCKRK